MLRLSDLEVPIVQAPMAGGPSTPGLVAAVSTAGGLGSLGGGYQSPERMRADIEAVRALTDRPFGVNLFVPEHRPSDAGAVAAYAAALEPLATELGVEPPVPAPAGDDHYREKVADLIADPVPLVSFTFGLPSREEVRALQEAGSAVVLNATTPEEATACLALDPQAVVLQGPAAGGHRAQHDQFAESSDVPLAILLEAIAGRTTVPLIAAGGIGASADVRALLSAGASAVQVGTLFLTSAEAGTRPVHRKALLSGEFTETVVTRVFSGRPARALRNQFIDRMAESEVVGYPEVHYLTSPLRAAARDGHGINLWAGTGFVSCREAPAADILAQLAP
ncbi:nitronate monooxygenase [Brevibacterium daeguense]|uniref:Propionate 3-nitronate monooxygenase n=1 Tax=Brevibacterium daeguense TaxID=909936 RepID=A0ABP8EMG9_9MICO|nr:nitronate monooxygenase [Brevibacterium daeguense]